MVNSYFSLFSGIGGYELAISRVFPKAECVGFSEIYKPAVDCYLEHFPTHKNFGDITKINPEELPDFDLLTFSSPCQDLSISNQKRNGLAGARSGLFYNSLDILNKNQPKYFLMENVASMSDENKDIISKELGVQPVKINSSLFTAQHRERYYWCNWPVDVSKIVDKNLIIDSLVEYRKKTFDKKFIEERCKFKVNPKLSKNSLCLVGNFNKGGEGSRIYSSSAKYPRVKNSGARGAIKKGLDDIYTPANKMFEQLQSFPIGWTENMKETHAQHCLGNAVTVDVIEFLMENLKEYINV